MFRLGADLKVYLHREPIDFRAGINSLAVLVQETMELDGIDIDAMVRHPVRQYQIAG